MYANYKGLLAGACMLLVLSCGTDPSVYESNAEVLVNLPVWVKTTRSQAVPSNAYIGAQETILGTNTIRQLYLCRGSYNGGIHPGKVVENYCHISYGGREIVLEHYEVLTNVAKGSEHWVEASDGYVPDGAVMGGSEPQRTLYICRADYKNGKHLGKLVIHDCMFGWGGSEQTRRNYELLLINGYTGDTGSGKGTNWMGSIPDATKLSQIDIPGTHDSGATHGQWSTTQTMSIAGQLDAGVRFLDIRLRNCKGNLLVHHGPVYQYLSFDNVLRSTTSFLSQHPTETVLMSVKDEYRKDDSDCPKSSISFQGAFDSYTTNSAYKDYWRKDTSVPKLGDVRGKIVLIRRFSASAGYPMGLSAPPTSWADNSPAFDDGDVVAQDRYNTYVDQKRADILAFFNRTRMVSDDKLHINFASGYDSGLVGLPNITKISDAINRDLDAYFSHRFAKLHRNGIVVMDHPLTSVINKIIAANFNGSTFASKRDPATYDVRVFDDANYEGPSANLMRTDSPISLTDLQWLGLYNDAISSIKVGAGVEAILHADAGNSGNIKSVRANLSNVGASFNDVTSSITVRNVPDGVMFFRDCGYEGPASNLKVFSPGYHSTGIYSSVGNDEMSSIRIGGNHSVMVYEDAGQKGHSKYYSASQYCLNDFNDTVSSAYVY